MNENLVNIFWNFLEYGVSSRNYVQRLMLIMGIANDSIEYNVFELLILQIFPYLK